MSMEFEKSGIENLDAAPRRGFPKHGVSLMVGPTRIGKTLLALQCWRRVQERVKM